MTFSPSLRRTCRDHYHGYTSAAATWTRRLLTADSAVLGDAFRVLAVEGGFVIVMRGVRSHVHAAAARLNSWSVKLPGNEQLS